ncbi:MAG: hypothetical protein ACP5UO_04720 [Thermoplasmata archaeon]
MTVKARTGRRRYVHFRSISPTEMKRLSSLGEVRPIVYRDITAIRVPHYSLPFFRRKTEEMGLQIDMVSGTLRSLRRKVSKVH